MGMTSVVEDCFSLQQQRYSLASSASSPRHSDRDTKTENTPDPMRLKNNGVIKEAVIEKNEEVNRNDLPLKTIKDEHERLPAKRSISPSLSDTLEIGRPELSAETSQLLREILQNKEKQLQDHLGNNNNINGLCANGNHGSMQEMCLGMQPQNNGVDDSVNDEMSRNSGELSGEESDFDSMYDQGDQDDGSESRYRMDGCNGQESVADTKEAKRARVENILTSMRQLPLNSAADQDNCGGFEMRRPKRKQYQPQHAESKFEHSVAKYKKLEKRALHEQLQQLQQQLHSVQKRYVELYDEEVASQTAGVVDMENNMYSQERKTLKPSLGFPDHSSKSNCWENDTDSFRTKQSLPSDSFARQEQSKIAKGDKQKSKHTGGAIAPLQSHELQNLATSLKSEISEAISTVVKSEITSSVSNVVDTVFSKLIESKHVEVREDNSKEEREKKNEEKEEKPARESPFRISPIREPHPLLPPRHPIGLRIPIPGDSAFEAPRLGTPEGYMPRAHNHHHPFAAFPLPFSYYPHGPMLAPPLYTVAAEPEQTEALPLVVNTPKKKRTKVTDTRLSPRAARALLHDSIAGSLGPNDDRPTSGQFPSMVPSVLPTSVAIPNPSLQHSDVLSFYRDHHGFGEPRSSGHSPLQESPSIPGSMHSPSERLQMLKSDMFEESFSDHHDHNMMMTSTLTPMHLRKAKLMFFYTRYPSSAILKIYFPDVKFNKNNTAQLVKWFSNFREFFYIQMEKYARQAIAEGCKHLDDLVVTTDSELFRVLNIHYNRNNQIEVPENFRLAIQATLREFYKAVIGGKDTEPSWKKSIYKVIARLDDVLPEYFKSPNWMDQLGEM